MHRWYEPFERVIALAVARGIPLSTPRMGERLDLASPHRGERWWRKVMEVVDAPKVSRRRFASCRNAGQTQP
jgi:hypothetical protein